MRMKDRQGMDQPVLGGDLPQIDQGPRVRQKVPVAHHRALGAPRRPGGIKETGKVIGTARDRVKFAGLCIRS